MHCKDEILNSGPSAGGGGVILVLPVHWCTFLLSSDGSQPMKH